MAMKMVGDLMNMGNEERVSKVSSRFNLNPDQRIRFCVGCSSRWCDKSDCDKKLKVLVNYFHSLF